MSSEYSQRLETYLESLYLMATTFSALSLHDAPAIGDTLLSLACSFLGRGAGALFLRQAEVWAPSATRGDLEVSALASAGALWQALIEERIAQIVPLERIPQELRLVPALGGGLAAVAITVEDRAVALLVLGASAEEEPFLEADLSFLTAAAGIGALSFASAGALVAQQRLAAEMEQTAARARRDADDKAGLLEDLDRKLAIIERQHHEILTLSMPVLEVWRGVLLLPIIGVFDEARGAEILPRLLAAVVERRSTDVIIDVTGAEITGHRSADQLFKLVKSLRLLGARGIITGIRPAAAMAMTALGVELSAMITVQNLEQGLMLCMQRR